MTESETRAEILKLHEELVIHRLMVKELETKIGDLHMSLVSNDKATPEDETIYQLIKQEPKEAIITYRHMVGCTFRYAVDVVDKMSLKMGLPPIRKQLAKFVLDKIK